jgi:hypothetical protein
MKSNYTSVEDAKEKLTLAINKALDDVGVAYHCTCPTGGSYGWDMLAHHALEWFLRNPPEGWHVARIYKHECYDWTITKK